MKKFEDLNYYDLLEVPTNASYFEIRQAYKEALAIYSEESLATYSLFTDKERTKILENIEMAFCTLIDENARADYDKRLLMSGDVDPSTFIKKGPRKPIPIFSTPNPIDKNAFLKRIKKIANDKKIRKISDQILLKETISGNDLKMLRESMEIDLEDIFEVARISVSIMQSIEENQTDNLPADVYLKNFLKIYAELLQINSKKIIDGYLKNIHPSQKTI